MAFKFLSIGKANAEIHRLETELAAITKDRDELKAAIEANNQEVSAEVQQQLTTATSQVEGLKADVAKLKTDLSAKEAELGNTKAELEKAQKELADGEVKITKAAALKAAEITGAQGQPPVNAAPITSVGAVAEVKNLKGLAKVIAIEKAESAAKSAAK